MATRTKNASREGGRDGHGRSLQSRSMPFVGLLIIPPIAWIAAMVLHYSIADEPVAVGGACGLLGAATALGAILMHRIGDGNTPRKVLLRWHACLTVALSGIGVTGVAAVGWNRWVTTFFLLIGEIVALSWLAYRIDAYRRDANKDEPETEDTLREELGLKGTKFARPVQHVSDKGELLRTEIKMQHRPGQTVDEIQKAVPGIESLAGAPRGRSRVVPTESAGRSNLVIIHKDVLKDLVPWPGPSSPGGCITEPLVTSMGEDQQEGRRYIAGGCDEAPNPSSTGWMGMTRTGKTHNSQMGAMEVMSRRNAQYIWFDTIKGAQTVRPMRHGLDIIVASDDPKVFKAGMKALIALVKWRADRLGECGYRDWSPKAATDPRLMMPFLIAHFEEADALCDVAPDEMVFLASKGLSAGLAMEISLQRADATSIPTGLRFNIGNWYCFGTGDEYSSTFALSSATVDAGAHPEFWKQSKVGYHYFEGIGVDADRYPVVHKSFFATDQQIEAHTAQWAPRMQPLDDGSIAALGGWYEQAKAETVALRAKWDGDGDALPLVHDGTSTQPVTTLTSTNTNLTRGADSPDDVADTDADDELAETRRQVLEEMEDDVTDGNLDLELNDDDPDDRGFGGIDVSRPVPIPPNDGTSWADKDAAPDKETALAAFERALGELARDEKLRDRDDPDVVVFQVSDLVDRYKFRSRPWFSEHLSAAAEGHLRLPGLALSRTDKPGAYRLEHLADVGNGA